MAKAREQELKAALTAAQAQAILKTYHFRPAFLQANTYFDTPDQALKNQNMGLRIRQFVSHAEQTLKVPNGQKHDLTEITDHLTLAEAAALIRADRIDLSGDVGQALKKFHIDGRKLHTFAQATTSRRLSPQAVGLLTIDHTTYPNGQSDDEVELEYHDYLLASAFFTTLSVQFGFKLAAPANKVARAAENVKSSQAD